MSQDNANANNTNVNNATVNNATVNPWEVSGVVDYNKLVKDFGTELIDNDLMERFERVTGHELHPWIKRGIFFSHRRLHDFLNAYENGDPIFLYTGRGPTSESLHLGHLIPFTMTLWLQKVFKCPLVIQIADDEKYYFKDIDFDEIMRLGKENSKDIIAFGFDPELTFIFSNAEYRGRCPEKESCKEYEAFVSDMKNNISFRTVQKIFGLTDENSNVGQYDWPFYQSAAAFYKAYPHLFNDVPAQCLVVYAIDQDPYFRMANDLAETMHLPKICSIMSTFIPPLTGNDGKMSSSVGTSATIFLTDDEKTIHEKVKKYAFSGGGLTVNEHRANGGNTDKDMSYQYLRYFEHDDTVLNNIKTEFTKGNMLCSEIKTILANKLTSVITEHQNNRKQVTEEVLEDFYSRKQLKNYRKGHDMTSDESHLMGALEKLGVTNTHTTYHNEVKSYEDSLSLQKKLRGEAFKNIVLQSNDKTYLLVMKNTDQKVNLNKLKTQLQTDKIKFAERESIGKLFNINENCASIFSLLPSNNNTTVLFDSRITNKKPKYVCFHPLRNDASLSLSYGDMLKFLQHNNIETVNVDVN